MGASEPLQPLDSVIPRMDFYSPDLKYAPSVSLDDDFKWLPEMHPKVLEEFSQYVPFYEDTLRASKLKELEEAMSACSDGDRIQLPHTFRKFFSNKKLPSRVPSTSANYFGLYPDELVVCRPEFAGGNGGILVRFWTDQQGCYYWYLYLDRHGRHCVVGTEQDLKTYMDEEDEEDDEENEENDEEQGSNNQESSDAAQTGEPPEVAFVLPEAAEEDLCIWAPNFKEFIFLIWASNTCDHKKTHLKIPLTEQEQEYFDHYGLEWGYE